MTISEELVTVPLYNEHVCYGVHIRYVYIYIYIYYSVNNVKYHWPISLITVLYCTKTTWPFWNVFLTWQPMNTFNTSWIHFLVNSIKFFLHHDQLVGPLWSFTLSCTVISSLVISQHNNKWWIHGYSDILLPL